MSAPASLAVLTADPPWPFEDRGLELHGAVRRHYQILTIDDICAFPLPPLQRDAALILWRVSSQVEEAYRVVRAWGFTPKSEIVWIKMRACKPCGGTGRAKAGSLAICKSCLGEGEHEAFGMGHSVRGAHETAIVAIRGRPQRLSAGERSTLRARMPVDGKGRPIHSAKPDEFFAKIERLYPGPYGELFARKRRPGWWADGDQLPALETDDQEEEGDADGR